VNVTGKVTILRPPIKTVSENSMPSRLSKSLQTGPESNAPITAPATKKMGESEHQRSAPEIGDGKIYDPDCGIRDDHSICRIIVPIAIATDNTENV